MSMKDALLIHAEFNKLAEKRKGSRCQFCNCASDGKRFRHFCGVHKTKQGGIKVYVWEKPPQAGAK